MKNAARNCNDEAIGVDVSTVGDRLSIFLNKINRSRNEIAKEADVVFSTVSNYLERDELPGPKFLAHLVRHHQLNVGWLLSGEGPIIMTELGQECLSVPVETSLSGHNVVAELKLQLAQQTLETAKIRDQLSRRIHQILSVMGVVASEYGLTQEQYCAVLDAIIEPDKTLVKLIGKELDTPHHIAAGE